MKTIHLILPMAIMFVLNANISLAGANYADKKHADNTLEMGVSSTLNEYYVLAESLVESDLQSSINSARSLEKIISHVNSDNFDSEQIAQWGTFSSNSIPILKTIQKAGSIEQVRKTFVQLTDLFFELVSFSGAQSDSYYQFCPMANEGKGAYWFSKSKTIYNPYFGRSMLNCGSTKTVFYGAD